MKGSRQVNAARAALLERAVAWFAENGVGDSSLRTLASGVGTSHRMLLYHFGSREALLAAVMEAVENQERAVLDELLATADDPFEAAVAFWPHVADNAQTFGPLFFELSGHAMLGRPYAEQWRRWLLDGWSEVLTGFYRRAGAGRRDAVVLARLSLAQARGLLFDLALTGDRPAADAAMERFTHLVRASLPAQGHSSR